MSIVSGVVLTNVIDESPHPRAVTTADLPPTTFDAENGFYIWWGLSEPAGVDLKSAAYTTPFKHYYDADLKHEKFLETLDCMESGQNYREQFSKYKKIIDGIKLPKNFPEDCFTTKRINWDKVARARQDCALLLQRYHELLQSPIIRDFTYPSSLSFNPNLLAILKTAKLYTAICLGRAVDGEWSEAAAGLISQIVCMRRFLPYSRAFVNNIIAKGVLYISLQGVVSLLNHPQCPKEVFSAVLAELPPLTYEEYGNRSVFINETLTYCFMLDEIIDDINAERRQELTLYSYFLEKLFLQRNTTRNYFYEYNRRVLEYDKQEPFLWQGEPVKKLEDFVNSKITGLTWRLKNPVGKMYFAIGMPSTAAIFFKSMRLRVTVDMVRILAELKLKYLPGQKIADLLPQLETYKKTDPGSGHPYKWNAKKRVLYSVGMDRTDNKGEVIAGKTSGTDMAVPCLPAPES